jgi:hypothetical protein
MMIKKRSMGLGDLVTRHAPENANRVNFVLAIEEAQHLRQVNGGFTGID